MARKRMIEVQCERCKRVEYVRADAVKSNSVQLNLQFKPAKGGIVKVSFEDLCDPCARTVSNLIQSIARDIKGKSPKRSKAKKTEEGPDISVSEAAG